jgi:hypothetical protein
VRKADVEAKLRELAEGGNARGLTTVNRDGGELDAEALDAVWRDVRRCAFCRARSVNLRAAMFPDAIPGRGRATRALFFGLCRPHNRLFDEDPAWREKMDRVIQKRRADRLRSN